MAESEDDITKLRAFMELFSGRFTTQEAATLIQLSEGDIRMAAAFVMLNAPEDVRRRIQEDQDSWQMVGPKVRRVREQRGILDRARKGRVDTTSRMFSCQSCDSVWWRRTPTRKEVSKCKRCRTRYDPLPREKEWGWAEFLCPSCNRPFGGYCAMWQTSPCFNCNNTLVRPTRIVPPSERQGEREGSRRSRHRCNAPECAGNVRAPSSNSDRNACVHPTSRRAQGLPQVVVGADVHDSSGSTVDTFLSQTDMERMATDFFPVLPDIPEEQPPPGAAN